MYEDVINDCALFALKATHFQSMLKFFMDSDLLTKFPREEKGVCEKSAYWYEFGFSLTSFCFKIWNDSTDFLRSFKNEWSLDI